MYTSPNTGMYELCKTTWMNYARCDTDVYRMFFHTEIPISDLSDKISDIYPHYPHK